MKVKIKSKKFKGKFISVNINEAKGATSLVVFLSGFSGSKNLPLFEKTTSEFLKNGFSVLRLSFCGDEDETNSTKNVPDISQMSFSVYVEEINNVLDSVGSKYVTITLIGHSFGAPISIMFLSKYEKYSSKTKLILWDSSLLPFNKIMMDKSFVFDPAKKLHFEKGKGVRMFLTRNSIRSFQK